MCLLSLPLDYRVHHHHPLKVYRLLWCPSVELTAAVRHDPRNYTQSYPVPSPNRQPTHLLYRPRDIYGSGDEGRLLDQRHGGDRRKILTNGKLDAGRVAVLDLTN